MAEILIMNTNNSQRPNLCQVDILKVLGANKFYVTLRFLTSQMVSNSWVSIFKTLGGVIHIRLSWKSKTNGHSHPLVYPLESALNKQILLSLHFLN